MKKHPGPLWCFTCTLLTTVEAAVGRNKAVIHRLMLERREKEKRHVERGYHDIHVHVQVTSFALCHIYP